MFDNTRKTSVDVLSVSRIRSISALALVCLPIALAHADVSAQGNWSPPGGSPFLTQVQQATAGLRDINAAANAGWFGRDPFCVSGEDRGAMGVHVANPALIGGGQPDVSKPQILIYEPQANGSMVLVGVEYVVIAALWDAQHTGLPPGVPSVPAVAGQLMDFIPAPNRYGQPAVYSLHAWAWRNNPKGNFAQWNPNVTCEKQPLPMNQ